MLRSMSVRNIPLAVISLPPRPVTCIRNGTENHEGAAIPKVHGDGWRGLLLQPFEKHEVLCRGKLG